ncbi:hypothetical protein L345_15247 [Ophiophagus hannah]|uniref:DUF4592 domain-containing protein n=1 Tax=Ophiophagus hannah TaxID=8665 RepID=V8NAS2_OPHHA|nr:hypothetical protein L345_15247 [Ophiophagus hannah]
MTVSVKTPGEASGSLEADVLLNNPMETVMPPDVVLPENHHKEVQSLIEADFGQDFLELQGTEDKMTKDDGYYRPDKLTQHGEVQEQKTEGKRKQEHWINLEAGKKEQMAETKFKSPMDHKRLQEFEGSQGEQVGKKLKLQEEQLYQMEEKKDQDHQGKGLKEQEKQGRTGELPEKLQAQIQKKSQDLEEQKQRDQQQAQHELEAQRQQEECKPREMEMQWQKEKKKKQQELEAQRQQVEAKRQGELELQRQQEEEQKRQCELQFQRQQQEEAKRQLELEVQRQHEEEQKRQCKLEVQRQHQEEARKQHELELQRQWEEEQKRQCELELQREREEEQKRQQLQRQWEEEQKRQCELELQRQREEEQKRQRELELQRQREEEQKRQRELELQRERDEEAKRQGELEIQRQWQEEQKQHEQEAQRQQEEKKRQYEEEEQRHKDCPIQKEQKVKDPQEEKRHQETEQNDNLIQQGSKDKKEEPEKQKAERQKISHQYLEKQKMKELKTVQTEKLSELKQQLLPEQKREIGQRKKEQESSKNLDDRNKLQEKGTAMKLKGQEEQQQNLNEKQFSTNEQKQEKSAKSVGSTEHNKTAEIGHLRAEKEMQQEEFIQRTEGLQLERHKILCLEEDYNWKETKSSVLEKSKEEKKSHQLHMNKRPEDKHLETVEKELQLQEEPGQQQRTQLGKEQKDEGSVRVHQAMNVEVEGRVLGEELRWQEVDARQTMSRGFTFQVSSGEKEIIFPKVNLSPVTPVKEAPLPSATKEFKDPSKSSRGLSTSSCVPHTAILVTGAQLCGTAVNLNQIKDTACKSLLGLTEEKKAMEAPQLGSLQKAADGRLHSTKVKHVQDSVDNQAILDEWASIRSKILKGAENDKFSEKDSGSLNRHSDDWTAKDRSPSHGNLRKTLSANAKFSITPAWQKFSEMSKTNAAAENKTVPEAESAAMQMSLSALHSDSEAVQTESPAGTKNVGMSPGKIRGRQEVAGNTEGCKFAKDLPSFLVPSLPYSPNKELSPSETSSATETQHNNVGSKKLDRASPGGEENVSPFGVKLRRTNYSLRFHYDQQAEQKKKKRYSAGDSFDGLPTPLTPDNEQDAKPLFLKDGKSLSQDRKDARLNSDNTTLTIISRSYTIVAPVSSPTGPMSAPGQEKSASKSPLPPKPALAPKPISQTPPTSPLTKPRRSHFAEPIGKRVSKVEAETSWRKSEGKGSPHPSQTPSESKNEEEESREKKSFFPSITMPWREKAEKKPEPLKKGKHSIDGSKVMEKGETTQPLWITLALQKQKGFREQQATREERRQAREAKQAEKLAKENASINNQADNKSNNMSRSNVLQKSTGPEEEKKTEMATSRFERREQLKKSNTLPSSVTVEITDSLSSSPLAKEVTKRFSTPDANPVSTEPAWLALAKRKAKAWSDCPQIIK